MSRDLYASLSGAQAAMRRLDVLAHNIANASSEGFKGSRVHFSLDGVDGGPMGQVYARGEVAAPVMTDGPITRDDDPHHLALRGQGFFQVQTPGGPMLTRDGNFQRDSLGQLVTGAGHPLMGQGGPIQIPEVAADGRVMGSESGEIDRLRLVDAPNAAQRGASLWDPGGATREAAPDVIQGALEGSNVDPVGLMVELVEAHRHFEAQQRVMRASDEMDQRLNRSGGQ